MDYGARDDAPHPTTPLSGEQQQQFSMLVDLSLADDHFLDFHNVLELPSVGDENMHANGSACEAVLVKTDSVSTPGPPSDEEFTIRTSSTLFSGPLAQPQAVESPPNAASPPPIQIKASTESASAASSSSSRSPANPSSSVANSEEDRKKRHNENERRRTNALKTRILTMRGELSTLEKQRERLQEQGAMILATKSSETAEKNQDFMEIVNSIDRLRSEQNMLKKQLQQWDMQNSTYQTMLSEFNHGGSQLKRLENGTTLQQQQQQQHGHEGGSDGEEDEEEDAIHSDDAPIFQKILFGEPMPRDEAVACVRSSFDEIMAFRNQKDFESIGGQVFGWRDKRILDTTSLQFMLAQKFEVVLPQELVYKTWHLLTTEKLYRRIQPQTTELKLLQRVDNDIVIVRLSVSSGGDHQMHRSILLISRARIDGGYLITYRSIPLSEGKRRFAESEGTYVSIFNWFMFLDSCTDSGVSACEVTFGGKVKNRSAEYLRYLMMEVVAGVVRWQTAVGHSKLRLTN